MKAIILAAGGGSRLAPIGITTPKVLIPILNKPLLNHHLDTIASHVDEVIVVIGPNNFGQQIAEYIQNQSWPVPVITAIQEQPLGTANAYQAAAAAIAGDHRLLCLNGDDLYSPRDIKQLLQHEFAVLGQPVTDPEKWGILNADQHGQLIQLVEKPAQFMGNLANTGAYLLSTEIFNLYHHVKPSSRGEYEFTETVTAFAQAHHVQTIQVADYWLPIGYPWHILDAHQKLTDQPLLGQNVQVGKNVSITGSSVIGDNVIIGDNSVITDSTILSGAVIGPDSQLSHSVVGQNVELGSGLKVKSSTSSPPVQSAIKGQMIDTQRQYFGAAIGDNVQIGNGVTINPGCKVWPNAKIQNNTVIEQDVTD